MASVVLRTDRVHSQQRLLRYSVLRVFVAAAIGTCSCGTSIDAQVFNWGGEWISAPDQALIAKNTSVGDRGWSELVDDLKQIQVYSITIEHTDDLFVVKFPRSVANPLNGVRFPAVGDRTDVLNFGEYWEKRVVTSHEIGSAVELSVTKSNGKWKEAIPEAGVTIALRQTCPSRSRHSGKAASSSTPSH